jgi:hypothetical protein
MSRAEIDAAVRRATPLQAQRASVVPCRLFAESKIITLSAKDVDSLDRSIYKPAKVADTRYTNLFTEGRETPSTVLANGGHLPCPLERTPKC